MAVTKNPPISTQAQPADQKTVRRHNIGLVLNNIVKGGLRSRAKVSEETGLNPSTVSSLIGELIERGLLRDVGVRLDGAVGRPGRGLELNPEGGAALGLEISDDGLGALALDLSSTPRYRAFFSQPNRGRDPEDVVRQLADLAREALTSFRSRNIEIACTIALPGLVGGNGELLEGPNIDWHQVPIQQLWHKYSDGLPVVLDNEARLAAYAELTSGAAAMLGTFAYISGGVGLGGGLVLDGRIFRGAHGFAGEFGHVAIERNDTDGAWNGDGTVQLLAGEATLARLAGLQPDTRPPLADADWMGRYIAERLRAGDPQALAAVRQVGSALGVGLASLLNLLDMQAIVLGGYFSHLDPWLLEPIEAQIKARVLSQRWCQCPILFSAMGREAAVRGAAAWSLDVILQRAAD